MNAWERLRDYDKRIGKLDKTLRRYGYMLSMFEPPELKRLEEQRRKLDEKRKAHRHNMRDAARKEFGLVIPTRHK